MSVQGFLETIKGGLDSANLFIDKLQKAPMLITLIFLASYHVWRTRIWDAKDEQREERLHIANNRKDSMANLYIMELIDHGTTKDSLNASKDREFQLMVEIIRK